MDMDKLDEALKTIQNPCADLGSDNGWSKLILVWEAAEAYRKIWPILEPVLKARGEAYDGQEIEYDGTEFYDENEWIDLEFNESLGEFFAKSANAMRDINKLKG